tara:strand:+ start:1235 stop:1582 length:348 start_codon:yes stop_codon:yes gene_type:complete
MKALPFIILFIIAWFFNSYLGMWLHPDFSIDYIEWQSMVIDRELVYENMFLIALFLGVFKSTRISKGLSVLAIILVISDIIDKQFHGITDYAYYDPIVILFGMFLGILIYRNARD